MIKSNSKSKDPSESLGRIIASLSMCLSTIVGVIFVVISAQGEPDPYKYQLYFWVSLFGAAFICLALSISRDEIFPLEKLKGHARTLKIFFAYASCMLAFTLFGVWYLNNFFG